MKHTDSPESQLDRAGELASFLRVGKSTVYSLAKHNKIPCLRFGVSGVRFDRQAVLAALSKPVKGK